MGDQGASPNGRKLPEAPLVAIGAVVLVAAIAAESRGSSRRQLRGRRCDAASDMSQGRAAVGTRPSWTRSSIKSK